MNYLFEWNLSGFLALVQDSKALIFSYPVKDAYVHKK